MASRGPDDERDEPGAAWIPEDRASPGDTLTPFIPTRRRPTAGTARPGRANSGQGRAGAVAAGEPRGRRERATAVEDLPAALPYRPASGARAGAGLSARIQDPRRDLQPGRRTAAARPGQHQWHLREPQPGAGRRHRGGRRAALRRLRVPPGARAALRRERRRAGRQRDALIWQPRPAAPLCPGDARAEGDAGPGLGRHPVPADRAPSGPGGRRLRGARPRTASRVSRRLPPTCSRSPRALAPRAS